jgi:N-acetylglucosamine-6-phosphate deacetylase
MLSSSSVLLQNFRLVDRPHPYQLTLNNSSITHLSPMEKPEPNAIDCNGDWLTLGGWDLQINGALGLAFPDLRAENAAQLDRISQFLWQQGIDAYCPTLVTTSLENIHRAMETIAQFTPSDPTRSAQILGIHLEGPCLNPKKRGAHPSEYLQPLTVPRIKSILGDHGALVKIITLAPELDPTGEVIPYLRNLGITVSLGHSLASSQQAQRAFDQGATMVTHAFNAMPGLHHREPGLLGAALLDRRVMSGLIADGQHVVPMMIELLLRAAPEGLFLVSDALAPLGLPDGCYPWDSRTIEVTDGTARLADGTLSGTTRGLLVGAQNLVKWGLCAPETAIALATIAPRRALNKPMDYIGQSAQHLIRWRLDPQSKALIWTRCLDHAFT